MFPSARLHLSEVGFPYGAFAALMATGIISIAPGLEDWGGSLAHCFASTEPPFWCCSAASGDHGPRARREAEGPKVCRLSAGGSRVRTVGPAEGARVHSRYRLRVRADHFLLPQARLRRYQAVLRPWSVPPWRTGFSGPGSALFPSSHSKQPRPWVLQ